MGRIYQRYSEAEKQFMWDRWQQGDSLHDIARLFDRPNHTSVQRIFSQADGINHANPADIKYQILRPRVRCFRYLGTNHFTRRSRGPNQIIAMKAGRFCSATSPTHLAPKLFSAVNNARIPRASTKRSATFAAVAYVELSVITYLTPYY